MPADVQYDAIASLIRRLNILTNTASRTHVLATPQILSIPTPDMDMVGIIRDAQVLVNPTNHGIIPNVLNRLKKECNLPIEVGTIKISGFEGNAAVYLVTTAGVVVFYVQPSADSFVKEIVHWGVEPKRVTVEVDKPVEVVREVAAPKPVGFWAKLAYAFS